MGRGGVGRGGTKKGAWDPGADLRHFLRETRAAWTAITRRSRLQWFVSEGERLNSTIENPLSIGVLHTLFKKYKDSPLQFFKLVDRVTDDERRHAEYLSKANATAVPPVTGEPSTEQASRSFQ